MNDIPSIEGVPRRSGVFKRVSFQKCFLCLQIIFLDSPFMVNHGLSNDDKQLIYDCSVVFDHVFSSISYDHN